ncbi:hypothetical protein SPF06_00505 [Sinomonas sp. JGH33]|uniref:Anti-sigma factor n=1 Tax=Sinomonas terricola TaxID=3110330 RepID=A0ABU5T0L2_9MICC|nr:hypothetical protein [Sinomonas sp. JGH33]MEA5453189.1 hypothetical protein [Sinomonas sp. JGH33]
MGERRRLGLFGGPGDHSRDPGHLAACAECRGALESERRYLAALRGAPVPTASSDLTERLVQQTRHLALAAEVAEVDSPRRRLLKAAGVAVGGAAMALAALALTAYAVAGDPLIPGAAASWPATVRIDGAGRALTASELQALSSAGWNCPELGTDGLRVESAEGYVLNGVPTLILRISDGTHMIALMEQRPAHASSGVQTTVLSSDFPSSQTAALVQGTGQAADAAAAQENPADRLARGLHLVLSAAGRP